MKNLYPWLKPLLFSLDPERAHDLSLGMLRRLSKSPFHGLLKQPFIDDPYEFCGIRFPNRVGLAAGLDKNGAYLDALGALGFGFVEIGTVTPKPQPGNDKPRMFRLADAEAIINRMGFNNEGVDALVERVSRRQYKGVLGINIGKNKATAEENATDDYITCMRKVYSQADYITVNISSPNTPGLRELQFGDLLDDLLKSIKDEQSKLATQFDKQVPIFVKIAPDLSYEEIEQLADRFVSFRVDGVIATNTTLERSAVEGMRFADEAGGLSGKILARPSTQVLSEFAKQMKGQVPLIGVGGIHDAASAVDKIKAGASLVQIYTGFIYQGPRLIETAAKAIREME